MKIGNRGDSAFQGGWQKKRRIWGACKAGDQENLSILGNPSTGSSCPCHLEYHLLWIYEAPSRDGSTGPIAACSVLHSWGALFCKIFRFAGSIPNRSALFLLRIACHICTIIRMALVHRRHQTQTRLKIRLSIIADEFVPGHIGFDRNGSSRTISADGVGD